MEDQKVYIIILNYNTWQDTIECLQSLLQQQYAAYEIIVVDNCSSNDSRTGLLKWAAEKVKVNEPFDFTVSEYKNPCFIPVREAQKANIHFLWSDKNGGYAYGNNVGIKFSRRQSTSHFIWILNNDTVVLPDTLQQLQSCFYKSGVKVGLVGCIQTYYPQPQIVQCLYGRFYSRIGLSIEQGEGINIKDVEQYKGRRIDYLYGACLLTHTSVLDRVGLLSEDYFLYFEELDFSYRIKREGLSLAFCFDTHILHKQGGSMGDKSERMTFITPFSDYNTFRSKFIFARKFYKRWITLYLCLSCLQIIHRIVKGKWKNVAAVLKGISNGLHAGRRL